MYVVYFVLKHAGQCLCFQCLSSCRVYLLCLDVCTVHDGLRLTWLDTPKTDVLAIIQTDQRL